nr:PREDICTED: phostensin [Stegastes partitus]
MPAWKRGIIQRRKMKQESLGDREKERDACVLQVDTRSLSDGLSDTDSSITVNLGSEPSLSPDPGLWLDAEPKLVSQVSVETIVPVHENPFIRTQSAWRKDRDGEVGSQDGESGRGRDIEVKIERFRDLSEGREKERSRDRSEGRENSREGCEKDKIQWKELAKDAAREQEVLKVRLDTEEKDAHPPSGPFPPNVPCLRTIRADNIIIIEQDRKSSDERRGRWRQVERERPEEENQGKRGMKMDLREILAGGGSVTEIRASEVLIIKPSASPEEKTTARKGREDGEGKGNIDVRRDSLGRELRTDVSWLREKETVKEKEKPWGQATVINKDNRKDSLDDNVFVERGGRVSQLLSKFGEHPKPPSRSKSSDNFLQLGRRKYSEDQDDQQSEERKADVKDLLFKGVPKRSFSFSDRVICAKENGLGAEGCYERKMRERIHSDRIGAPWEDVTGLGKENKIKLGCAQLLDKGHFGKHRDGRVKTESEVRNIEPVDKRAADKVVDADGDKGFTVASVKNTEGISFARRVPIRQDGKARAERDVKRLMGEKSLEKEASVEKDSEAGEQIDAQDCGKTDFPREDGLEIPPETSHSVAASAEPLSPSHHRYDSAFTECSQSLLCAATHKEWSGTGPRGPYLTHSVLSQHTEDLISKIEKIGDTTVYSNERGERAYKAAQEMTKESKQEVQPRADGGSEGVSHDITPRSPKRIAPIGMPPGPIEIQIPRTVFYVAEEMVDRKKSEGQSGEGQDWEGGRGVERRDSWRIGKPLSRIESLREKIRQRELERLQQREAQDGGEAAEISDVQATEDRYEKKGRETEKEWEAAAHVERSQVEADRGQEDAAVVADVSREVGVLKTCPQLPASVPHSQAVRAEEVTGSYATATSEATSDSFQISDDEDDSLKHVEEQLRCHRGRHESREGNRGEEKEEELSEEEVEEYTSPLDKSLSPSPPHPNSLAAMSRIYNLETVGSRSGLCVRERTVDIASSVHLVKVKPLISTSQQRDGKGDDICGVQSIQRQIEQFQLKEQEALKASPNTPLKDRDTKGQQSPKQVFKQHVKDDVKTQKKDEETTGPNPKVSLQRASSPSSQIKQTITIAPSLLRSQSPDNTLKPVDCTPTPASSPSSPSPSPTPSVSPSPNPSPTLFSIRSASGGQVKRGATITITPKKPVGGGTTVSVGRPIAAGSTSVKTPGQQTTPTVVEPVKKKYPTVEEIEVIGGYQNLEKSCLVKNRGIPKRGKVCFDEDQLEQVCEYPSETFLLTFSPFPHGGAPLGRMERLQGEEAQEEEGEVEAGPVVLKSTRSTGITTGPRLRVDESCPR